MIDVKDFDLYVDKMITKNMDVVGKMFVDKIRTLMEGRTRSSSTKFIKSINYKIEGNNIIITSDSMIPIYIDKGTKPHIIRPKIPGGHLTFRSGSNGVSKKGNKYKYGDWRSSKEVHHPGFEAKPFINLAIFLVQKELGESLLQP